MNKLACALALVLVLAAVTAVRAEEHTFDAPSSLDQAGASSPAAPMAAPATPMSPVAPAPTTTAPPAPKEHQNSAPAVPVHMKPTRHYAAGGHVRIVRVSMNGGMTKAQVERMLRQHDEKLQAEISKRPTFVQATAMLRNFYGRLVADFGKPSTPLGNQVAKSNENLISRLVRDMKVPTSPVGMALGGRVHTEMSSQIALIWDTILAIMIIIVCVPAYFFFRWLGRGIADGFRSLEEKIRNRSRQPARS